MKACERGLRSTCKSSLYKNLVALNCFMILIKVQFIWQNKTLLSIIVVYFRYLLITLSTQPKWKDLKCSCIPLIAPRLSNKDFPITLCVLSANLKEEWMLILMNLSVHVKFKKDYLTMKMLRFNQKGFQGINKEVDLLELLIIDLFLWHRPILISSRSLTLWIMIVMKIRNLLLHQSQMNLHQIEEAFLTIVGPKNRLNPLLQQNHLSTNQ